MSLKARLHRAIRLLSAAVLLSAAAGVQRAHETELWMASTDPFGRGLNRPEVALDYLDLFTPQASWQSAAGRLAVFKVGPAFVDRAPMETMRSVFSNLKQRGIALAWEAGMVPPGAQCRGGTEGYAGDTARSVARIKAAGGELRYVAMDEPFWYGHWDASAHTCHLSVGDLARGVAGRVAMVRSAFPTVEVGDIEPVGASETMDYPAQIAEWARTFEQATGRPLAFFHADINWNGNWRRDLPALAQRLRDLRIPGGIIVNGDPGAATDRDWTDAATRHMQLVVDDLGLKPYAYIFQTWDARPTRMLPESQPGTLTNLVLRNSRPAARIELAREPGAVAGRVIDHSGAPTRAAKVQVTALDVNGVGRLRDVSRNGIVPRGATTALFVLRVGAECACGGDPVHIAIGPMQFREEGVAPVIRSLRPGGDLYELDSDKPQQVAINTAAFPVRSGTRYEARIALRVRDQATRPGYLALVFVNGGGKEIRRERIPLQAPEEPLGVAVTDRSGRFSIPYHGSQSVMDMTLRVRVEGSDSARPTLKQIGPEIR